MENNNIFDMYVSYSGLFEVLDNMNKSDELSEEFSNFTKMVEEFGLLNNENIKNKIKNTLSKHSKLEEKLDELFANQ